MNDASDSKEVRLEIDIDASPETVFALLTDPAHMKTWLAETVEAVNDTRWRNSAILGARPAPAIPNVPLAF